MTERYIDPNSGAAPQPGGFVTPAAENPPQDIPSFENQVQSEPAQEDWDNQDAPQPAEEPQAEEPQEAQADAQGDDSDAEADADDAESEEQGDYSELLAGTVEDVLAYIEEHPEEKEAVQAAEAEGKDRAGIRNA